MTIVSADSRRQVAPDVVPSPSSPYYMYFVTDGSTATLSPGTPTYAAGTELKMDSTRTITAFLTGVTSFNSRSGAVSPVQADYDGFFLTPAEGNAAYPPVARTISTTAPLTGGGDLSANRTLALTTSPTGQTPVGVTRVISTTAPLSGGGDFSADRTFAISAATVSASGSMSANDKKKSDQSYKDAVTDGGCDPTGVADCTAQVQALQDAMTSGGIIFFPVGTYRFNSTVNVTNGSIIFSGAGRRKTLMAANNASSDMFNVTGDAVFFERMRFTAMDASGNVDGAGTSAARRTGGFAVTMTSSSDSSGMHHCDILFHWSGIQSSGSLHYFEDLNIREYGNNAINGQCILINGVGDRYIRRITTDNGSNPTGFAGVRVQTCASLVISDCNIIHAGAALELSPGAGQTVPSVEAVNCFFDTSVYGLRIIPTSTGVVYRSKFTGCWFGTHTTAGIEMNNPGGATSSFDGITFDNCEIYGCPIGISTPTGGGKWTLTGGSRIAGCTTGVSLFASAGHFPTIRGNEICPTGGFGVNGTGILVTAGTYKGLIIADNNVGNNTTNATLGAVTVAAGEAGWYRIVDNVGINPRSTSVAPVVPASTVTATNTSGFRVNVILKGGTVTVVTVNGVATGISASSATGACVAKLDPGGTIAITYSVAPTWVWITD